MIYTRVSTQGQATSGAGLEAQEQSCREHCARLGLEVLAVHTDAGISGKDEIKNRPGLQATIDTIRANPGAIVVVYSLSRLARRQAVLWTLLDDRGAYGLAISSATEPFETSSALGKALLGMLSVWAQLEADLATERTKVALAAVAARGVRLGAPSMVEVVRDGVRSIDPQKAAIVARVRELYQTGHFTHASLAEHLNREGLASVRGGRWHPRTIGTALRVRERVASAAGEGGEGPSCFIRSPVRTCRG